MDKFYRLPFLLPFLLCSARAHKSIYDQYVAAKNISRTLLPQIYLNHPFETSNTSRRLQSANWQPLRIHVDTSDFAKHSFSSDGQNTLKRITSTILPLAIELLSKHLYVIRVNNNLKVAPYCLQQINGQPCCGQGNPTCHWAPNTCADVAVPDSHKTVGVPNADFVAYLTANEATADNVLALGVTCKVDQHDRPLAGQVKLNLASFTDSLPINYMVSAITHELSHALGWNHDSFVKFRDENGNIRTNVITTKNALDKTVSLLSTPAITKYVRSHFGCDSLAGMELEDQGGDGTAGSHPEKRIFPESYMGGVLSTSKQEFIVDGMALTVFQDSGWYQVKHLDQAGRLSFGRGMGCRVPTHKCNDWGAEANARGMFCSQDEQTFCLGNQKQVRGSCQVGQYSGSLPSMFQYFSDPSKGGTTQIADFCPAAVEYNNGDCTNAQYSGVNADNAQGTQIGSNSRCFMTSLLRNGYMLQSGLHVHAGCLLRTCKSDALEIQVNDQTVSCPVSIKATSVTVDGYQGYLVCPPYSGLTDIRCSPTCSTADPSCLGPKGSAANYTGSIANPGNGGIEVVNGRY